MYLIIRGLMLSLALGLAVLSNAAYAELKAPKIGTRLVWSCTGPYSEKYDLTVTRIKNGVVRYDGVLDGARYFSEKHAKLTGTSLWYKLSGDRRQWFDMEDYVGFHKLIPGSRFKGAVPAQHGDDKWVWDYQVSVGEPQEVRHPVLGQAVLVPISEERKVFHGTYWSRMTTHLLPEAGISVWWRYEDPRGLEECDLVLLKP